MAWVTAVYLVYLFAPIVLLLVGSFGESWFNTLLPTGFTGQWYEQVAADGSFRRAFRVSLHRLRRRPASSTRCVGLPLAYAIYQRRLARRARRGAHRLSAADRGAAARARLRLHAGLLLATRCRSSAPPGCWSAATSC